MRFLQGAQSVEHKFLERVISHSRSLRQD
jgi:hypothetical protein